MRKDTRESFGDANPKFDKVEIQSLATEIDSWLQDAVGDCAGYDEKTLLVNIRHDEKAMAKVKQAKKDGVVDICGWYADEIYNDVDTLCDLTGDRIHDDGKGDYEAMIHIANEIAVNGHKALQDAMERHIARWREMLPVMVVCTHCQTILKRQGSPKFVSHSDCLGYQDKPCNAGRLYHLRLSRQLGYQKFDDYLHSFSRKQ